MDEYIDVDCDVIVSEVPTDDEIVNSVLNKSETEEEEEEEGQDDNVEQQITVTNKDASDALNILYKFFETNAVEEGFFTHYCQMKKMIAKHDFTGKKQQSISKYFKRIDHV